MFRKEIIIFENDFDIEQYLKEKFETSVGCYLFCTHMEFKPVNCIAKYKKLWKHYSCMEDAHLGNEIEIEFQDGFLWCGFMNTDITNMVNILLEKPNFVMMVHTPEDCLYNESYLISMTDCLKKSDRNLLSDILPVISHVYCEKVQLSRGSIYQLSDDGCGCALIEWSS